MFYLDMMDRGHEHQVLVVALHELLDTHHMNIMIQLNMQPTGDTGKVSLKFAIQSNYICKYISSCTYIVLLQLM